MNFDKEMKFYEMYFFLFTPTAIEKVQAPRSLSFVRALMTPEIYFKFKAAHTHEFF